MRSSIDGETYSDFDLIGAGAIGFDEPYSGVWRSGLDLATFDRAIQMNCNMLLTGVGGDELLDRTPYHVADLIRRGNVFGAWHESTEFAKFYRWNPWIVFYPFGLANVFPVWSRLGIGRRLHWSVLGIYSDNEWSIPSFLKRGFLNQTQWRDRAALAIKQQFLATHPMSVSVAIDSCKRRSGNAQV